MSMTRRTLIKLLAGAVPALKGAHAAGRIARVELLGQRGKLEWSQDESGLKVSLPAEQPGAYAFALKINGLNLDQV